ncbi:MAG TPA: hypothetical protein VK968_15510 [Roseimicrobium sp.]|nr:hypothetical protein [Roseimicrobium sp.]
MNRSVRLINIFCAIVFISAPIVRSAEQNKEPGAAAPPSPSISSKDFHGKWYGKWDGRYGVRFTITPAGGKTDRLNVIYEWEETLGDPYEKSEGVCFLDGEKLKVGKNIELTLVKGEKDACNAKGTFTTPRTAIMRKLKVE